MKIALISPPWNPVPPPKYGGAETVVDNLARALVRQGYDVHLIAPEGSTCPIQTQHITTGTQPYAFSPVCTEAAFVADAMAVINDLAVDIVHDHTILGPLYARGFPHIPMVTTNHAPFMGDINTIYRHLPENVRVVAISHHQATLAEMPVDVIHHGVDQDFFEYGEGAGDEKGEYLLFLGRIWGIKGVHLAAKAARESGHRLVIAAKMNEQAEKAFYETDVKPYVGENVEFVGEVGGREKVELLQNAKALVNPLTWEEPFGLVMAEALACGTPVIGLNAGPTREIVEDAVTGIVCNDPSELADAFDRVSAIERKKCRESVDEYFNMDRMAAEYVELYSGLLQR